MIKEKTKIMYLEDASQLVPNLQHCTSVKLDWAGEFWEPKCSSPASDFCTYCEGIIKNVLPKNYQPAMQKGPRCKGVERGDGVGPAELFHAVAREMWVWGCTEIKEELSQVQVAQLPREGSAGTRTRACVKFCLGSGCDFNSQFCQLDWTTCSKAA